jgi:hypothetical protein
MLGCWCHMVDRQLTTWATLDEVVCHGDLQARLADELPEGRDVINWARETLGRWSWQERRTHGASEVEPVVYEASASELTAQGPAAKASNEGLLPLRGQATFGTAQHGAGSSSSRADLD